MTANYGEFQSLHKTGKLSNLTEVFDCCILPMLTDGSTETEFSGRDYVNLHNLPSTKYFTQSAHRWNMSNTEVIAENKEAYFLIMQLRLYITDFLVQ